MTKSYRVDRDVGTIKIIDRIFPHNEDVGNMRLKWISMDESPGKTDQLPCRFKHLLDFFKLKY